MPFAPYLVMSMKHEGGGVNTNPLAGFRLPGGSNVYNLAATLREGWNNQAWEAVARLLTEKHKS